MGDLRLWLVAGGIAMCAVGVFLLIRNGELDNLLDENFLSPSKTPVGVALTTLGIVLAAGAFMAGPFSGGVN